MSVPQKFFAEVEKNISSCFEPCHKNLAKMTVSINSTLSQCVDLERKPIQIKFKSKKRKTLISLAILSHYLEDKNLAFYLKDALLNLPEVPEYSLIKFITKRKGNLELYLIEVSQERSNRYLFGNLLNHKDLIDALNSIFVFKKSDTGTPKAKRMIGVGYRDKGHLPNYHEWYPKHDISLTEQQNIIEANRQAAHDLEDLISGLLL